MRKLNTKNKNYILALSIFVLLAIVGIAIFIIFKIKDMNIKYVINADSYVYNSEKELLKIEKDTYAKKTFLNNYYAVIDDKKVSLYENPVIYNETSREITLLGTFNEILANGQINKLKGENKIVASALNRIFKISDRRYLVIGSDIRSQDGSFTADDYLLLDLDKVGNAYLYNNDLNIKTFAELTIVTEDFSFDVNNEMLTRDDEDIDLSKINGSTNQYASINKEEEKPPASTGDSSGSGSSGSGSGSGQGSGDGTQNVPGAGTGEGTGNEGGYTDSTTPGENVGEKDDNIIIDPGENKVIVARKTSILDTKATFSTIDISYLVHDPFEEYTKLNVTVVNQKTGQEILCEEKECLLDKNDTNLLIEDLDPDTKYLLTFYYSYLNADNTEETRVFDTALVSTKSMKAKISLEKIRANIVQYKVKIDDHALDENSCHIRASVINSSNESRYEGYESVDITAARSSSGFVSSFELNLTEFDEFIVLSLDKCTLNGKDVYFNAYYKFKI